MCWLGGILVFAGLVGVGALVVAVFRHGRRETEKAEKIMDEITLSLLQGKPVRDGKNEANKVE
jgi:hypothetical protein